MVTGGCNIYLHYLMKGKILVLASCLCLFEASAQDQTIGPLDNLNVLGNLVVKQSLIKSPTSPTTAQTYIIPSNGGNYISTNDSVGRVKSHNAPPALYQQNRNGYFDIYPSGGTVPWHGIEISFEYFGLGDGDSLIIASDGPSGGVLMRLGAFSNTSGTFSFNVQRHFLQFRSNSDLSLGIGFSFVWRRLYNNPASQQPVVQPVN